jgi:tRNA(Ile2) C34 agmatinyltransferase TiaS
MTCKGICICHKAASNNYSNGQKRCQVCDLFVKCNGLRCPCCGYRLRTKPRKFNIKKRLTGANIIAVLTPRVGRGP